MKLISKYAVMESGMLWEEPYESLADAKRHVEIVVDSNGNDPSEFIIYELTVASRPKTTKIEWE